MSPAIKSGQHSLSLTIQWPKPKLTEVVGWTREPGLTHLYKHKEKTKAPQPTSKQLQKEGEGAWKVTVLCVITKGHVSRLQKPVSFPRTWSSHPPAHGLSPASLAQQPPGHPESGYQPWMIPVILYNCGQIVSRQDCQRVLCSGGRVSLSFSVSLGEVVSGQDENRKLDGEPWKM